MSIFPSVDLVTEVAQAADPHRRDAAVTRLNEISSTRLLAEDAFGKLANKANAPTIPSASATSVAVLSGRAPTPPRTIVADGSPAASAAQKFEAFVIQSCLETILPKSEDGVFGSGAGASVWRSMVAEQIGDQIAKAGGFGLRKILEQRLAHPDGGDKADNSPSSAG
jgi:hypothetical protein